MDIREHSGRAPWETFLGTVKPPTFLQSWAWGETQRALGEGVMRLGAYDDETLQGIAQAVTVTARRGKFLHVPHGPVIRMGKGERRKENDAGRALLEALRDQARKRRLAFLRVSPIQEDTEEHRVWYRDFGFRPAPIHVHAERMWVLDLAPNEDALLAGMRKTTRNLIRRAERDGVTVRLVSGSDPSTDVVLRSFTELYVDTAKRERFVPFSHREIETEVRTFIGNNEIICGIAEYRGQPLAGAIVPLTPWSAFYHHGASARTAENIPVAYALQWALIREAKRRGCAQYNFWGITPTFQPGLLHSNLEGWSCHPWAGLTLFKTGFGGREVPLVPTQDLPLSAGYWPAYVVDTLRRWKRRA